METVFLVKKIFQVQQSVKKVMLTVFWDIKGPMTIDFLEKGATVNNTSTLAKFTLFTEWTLCMCVYKEVNNGKEFDSM